MLSLHGKIYHIEYAENMYFMQSIKDFIIKYKYFIVICFILTCGIFCRIGVYIKDDILWFDEVQLAYNITENSGFFWAFSHLQNYQVAPALFLIGVKFLTLIFRESEHVLRFIPFIAGVFSVPVFYILSKQILSKKRSIIFANFLFAINFILIYYSSVFKQYSLDVLIFMLVLMYSAKIDVKNLKNIDILKYSVIFTVFFLICQPSVFILFGFILYHFLKTIKNKYPYKEKISAFLEDFKFCLIPVIPFMLALFYKYSMPYDFKNYMEEYWQYGFLSLTNIAFIIKENLEFFCYQSKYLFILAPFIIIGFFICLFKKSRINRILILALFGASLASMLHAYPLVGRVAVYLMPLFIIFIAQCLDIKIVNNKIDKITSYIIILLSLILLFLYQTGIICKKGSKILYNSSEAPVINAILKENFDRENHILILPTFCKLMYDYYSKQTGFFAKNTMGAYTYNMGRFLDDLNRMEKGKVYWVYLIHNLDKNELESQKTMIESWLNTKVKTEGKNKVFSNKAQFGLCSFLYLVIIKP